MKKSNQDFFAFRMSTSILLVIIAIVVSITLAILGINNLHTNFNNENYECVTYFVKDGDTLWSIGKESIGETADVRDWINAVEKINNISANISPGQSIRIYVCD